MTAVMDWGGGDANDTRETEVPKGVLSLINKNQLCTDSN